MGVHLTTFEGSVTEAIKKAIVDKLPGAEIEVQGAGGHFTVAVASSAFTGKRKLECHRMVLSSIKHLMAGDNAPVHAIDSLQTRVPG